MSENEVLEKAAGQFYDSLARRGLLPPVMRKGRSRRLWDRNKLSQTLQNLKSGKEVMRRRKKLVGRETSSLKKYFLLEALRPEAKRERFQWRMAEAIKKFISDEALIEHYIKRDEIIDAIIGRFKSGDLLEDLNRDLFRKLPLGQDEGS
jgi:hypothetical protein